MKKTLITLLLASFMLITLNACSTVEGLGKDIQRAGQAVEKEATKQLN